jgi:diadenosine tetraphosphate (Ap4A) HIT family hydrolase
MTSTQVQCDFCDELSGGTENSFSRIYKRELESRVLFHSDEFAVIPSLGQIVEGYLLVLPIKHFKALGDLNKPSLDQLATILECVGRILKNHYGSYVLFEHGTRSEGVGGCGIYHAHLHVTPLAGIRDPVDTLRGAFPYTKFKNLAEIRNQSVHLRSYLFYRDAEAGLYLFDTGPLRSQYYAQALSRCAACGKLELARCWKRGTALSHDGTAFGTV